STVSSQAGDFLKGLCSRYLSASGKRSQRYVEPESYYSSLKCVIMNIQRKIFLSIAFLLCFSAQAQFSSFEAEGQVFYQVKGVVPYTSLEFYSHTGGGKLLQTQEADEAGKLTLVSDKDFKPAFVLNRKTQEAGKLSGNGK